MRAAITTGPGEVTVVDDLLLDDPQVGEVIVEVSHCGVCLTDVHISQGQLPFPLPAVCGHEVAGLIAELGPGVQGLEVGTHVVVTCRPPCRRCYWCVRGEAQLCSQSLGWKTGTLPSGESRLSWRGAPIFRGVGVAGFAEYVLVPAAGVIPVPKELPSAVAAVLGCAVQTGAGAVFNTAAMQPGQTAIVLGLGGVGTAVIQAARASGAGTVIGVDPRADRRNSAIQAGVDLVLDPTSDDVAASVYAATGGIGVDLAFDIVGGQLDSAQDAFMALRPGGLLVLVGLGEPGAMLQLPAAELISDERRVAGCFLGSADPHREIPRLVELDRLGRLDLQAFVGDRCGFQDLPQLLTGAAAGAGLRTVLQIGERS